MNNIIIITFTIIIITFIIIIISFHHRHYYHHYHHQLSLLSRPPLLVIRWLPTFGKNFKLFLKPRFSEAKFNADSKSGKKKWVSRACFRDNQHLMEAYAGVFEVRMAPPEVIRTKINTHKIIVLCRLNKCTNDGKWTIVQHQMNIFDEKTNK